MRKNTRNTRNAQNVPRSPVTPQAFLPTLPPRSPPYRPPGSLFFTTLRTAIRPFATPTDPQPSFYPPHGPPSLFSSSLLSFSFIICRSGTRARIGFPFFTFKEKTKNPSPLSLSLSLFFFPLALFIPLRRAENPKALLDCSQMQLRIKGQSQDGLACRPSPRPYAQCSL